MKLYGIHNCSTVKKARAWLEQHAIAYEFHDFKKLGLDATTGQQWLIQQPWEKLVNRSGMTWRNLNDAEKNAVVDSPSALSLMQDKTSVIKRPVLVENNQILALGFNETDYVKLLAKHFTKE